MSDITLRMYFWATNLLSSKEERGQTLIEYALFGGGLAILIIAAVGILNVAGQNPIETMLNGIEGCIDFQAGGCTPF